MPSLNIAANFTAEEIRRVYQDASAAVRIHAGASKNSQRQWQRSESYCLRLVRLNLQIALELLFVDLASTHRWIHSGMNIRVSGPVAHSVNGLLELAGGNALTGWPNNVGRSHSSCDRCRGIRARWLTAATARKNITPP